MRLQRKIIKGLRKPSLIGEYVTFKLCDFKRKYLRWSVIYSFILKILPKKLSAKFKANYKLHYHFVFFQYLFFHSWRKHATDIDLALISADSSRGWILDAICREIARYYPKKTVIYYSLNNLPIANNYFFSHYSLLPMALKLNPHIQGKGLYVYYTHPRELAWSEKELVYIFNRITKVICMCSLFEKYLQDLGVNAKNVTHIVGGADEVMFSPHNREGNIVGVCTAYYERKSPDRILELIKLRPDLDFLLLGKNWNQYIKYEELISQPNLEYVETEYINYPAYYQRMSVYISPAILEGGPIPLLEAMMSNVVPVASETGFALDVIENGKNGYLFPVGASALQISSLIDNALLNRTDIRSTVAEYTWKRFSQRIQDLITKSS